MVIAGQQVLTKTFSNGVRVFSRETTKKGAKVIRTTAFDKSGRLICDRYKTLASENIMGGKLNTITKHYFGENALGEAYTKGKYNVTGRIYDTKGLREKVDLHTTPTYLEKYGSWYGAIEKPNAGKLNDPGSLKTFFDYDITTKKFSDVKQTYGGFLDLPTVASISGKDQTLIKKLAEKLNFMKLKV